MQKNYFTYLASVLHEAEVEEEIIDGAPKMRSPEEEIPEQPVEQLPPEEMPADGMEEAPPAEGEGMEGDAAYMEAPPGEMTPEIDIITKQEQKKKLFENFDELLNLVEYSLDNIRDNMNYDLLDVSQRQSIQFIIKSLERLSKKINDFQMISFNSREYEECLYTYMLLRSELLTTIKFIRKTLNLNKIDSENKN